MVNALLGSVAEAILRCLSMVAGYVSNSSTFPQPLSEDEEARYLSRLQTGDDEARAILIERNLRLVAHIVNTLLHKLQGKRDAGRVRPASLRAHQVQYRYLEMIHFPWP